MDFAAGRATWTASRGFSPTGVGLRRTVLQWIGRELQETYQGLVSEPLPEYLTCIVDKLEARGSEKSC